MQDAQDIEEATTTVAEYEFFTGAFLRHQSDDSMSAPGDSLITRQGATIVNFGRLFSIEEKMLSSYLMYQSLGCDRTKRARKLPNSGDIRFRHVHIYTEELGPAWHWPLYYP